MAMRKRRFGSSGPLVRPQSPYFGAFPMLWVSTDGDDLNDGSFDAPLRTIRAALTIASVSSVPTEINMGPGDFSPDGLDDPQLVRSSGVIVGTEFDDLSADVTVSGYNSTTRVITFSPSPGWSVNQWKGKLIQWQSGPSGPYASSLAASALISQNAADSVTVAYPASITSTPAVGDVMRIVEPATRFIGATSVIGPPGAIANASLVPLRIQPVYRELKNIIFDGLLEEAIVFDGSFRMEAVAATDYGQVYFTGSCWAGEGVTRNGRGITALNAVGRHPEVRCRSGNFVMYLVGGRYIVEGGGIALWSGGSLQDSDGSFPHGVLCSLTGGMMLTFSQTIAGRLFIDAGATASVVAEGSLTYISSPITHQGTGMFIRTQNLGGVTLLRNPVVTGSLASLLAEINSYIRLSGVDGATLGPATAGVIALGGVVRAAAPFAPGTSVCTVANFPADLSNIYRTP
jgi:hypothetical protein